MNLSDLLLESKKYYMIRGRRQPSKNVYPNLVKVDQMSQFSDWFNTEYKHWSLSQPGEEDFLAFCNLLGHPPSKVLGWLHGEFLPEGPEILSFAGTLGTKVYSTLGLAEGDSELLKVYHAFSHLNGEFRSCLAQALWEAEKEMKEKGISASSTDAGEILSAAFTKWGIAPNPKQ